MRRVKEYVASKVANGVAEVWIPTGSQILSSIVRQEEPEPGKLRHSTGIIVDGDEDKPLVKERLTMVALGEQVPLGAIYVDMVALPGTCLVMYRLGGSE